ncbi:MAG: hypothetical protein Kow0076_5150 [Francisella sp.]
MFFLFKGCLFFIAFLLDFVFLKNKILLLFFCLERFFYMKKIYKFLAVIIVATSISSCTLIAGIIGGAVGASLVEKK